MTFTSETSSAQISSSVGRLRHRSFIVVWAICQKAVVRPGRQGSFLAAAKLKGAASPNLAASRAGLSWTAKVGYSASAGRSNKQKKAAAT